MKGVNKRIIEIEEPENEYIEKVQVFLRQNGNIRLAKSKEEAQRYASGITCWKRPAITPVQGRWLGLAAAAVAAVCIVLVVLL
ncbi:MAG: hypothetical protein MSH10_00860 [Pygmaiobacter massiliensis]|nr:hypothetical protein [Pygmaiobacter massiliensis]